MFITSIVVYSKVFGLHIYSPLTQSNFQSCKLYSWFVALERLAEPRSRGLWLAVPNPKGGLHPGGRKGARQPAESQEGPIVEGGRANSHRNSRQTGKRLGPFGGTGYRGR